MSNPNSSQGSDTLSPYITPAGQGESSVVVDGHHRAVSFHTSNPWSSNQSNQQRTHTRTLVASAPAFTPRTPSAAESLLSTSQTVYRPRSDTVLSAEAPPFHHSEFVSTALSRNVEYRGRLFSQPDGWWGQFGLPDPASHVDPNNEDGKERRWRDEVAAEGRKGSRRYIELCQKEYAEILTAYKAKEPREPISIAGTADAISLHEEVLAALHEEMDLRYPAVS